MSAMPAAAQAPAPTMTAFDGTYAGVSRNFAGTMRNDSTRVCPPNGQPGPLTIAGGAARYQDRVGTYTGHLAPTKSP